MTNLADPLPVWLAFGLLEMAIGLFFGYLIGSGRSVVISARLAREEKPQAGEDAP